MFDIEENDEQYHDRYINNWNEVPSGGIVVEDTYPEVYVLIRNKGVSSLRQIGWQVPQHQPINRPFAKDRIIDFEPNAYMDQPWIWLPDDTEEEWRQWEANRAKNRK